MYSTYTISSDYRHPDKPCEVHLSSAMFKKLFGGKSKDEEKKKDKKLERSQTVDNSQLTKSKDGEKVGAVYSKRKIDPSKHFTTTVCL